ncbi:MAG TPA: MXAN_5187 C-terminal domain-containing protein [Pyrinomonadaceae bacterium]|nr:MXAN_5187 C-terminal domain-containing protein [Pyrinomonadaceae bacterium]
MPTNNNRLARLAHDRRERNKGANPETVTIEDRLARLEEDIRRLKVEYDIYFNGGSKRPPYDTKLRIESHLKRLGDDRALTFAQRFHYNSLATRYNSFREIWRRTLKSREEGRDAVTVSRATRQAETQFKPATFACNDVRHDVQTVKGLYDALMDAKRSCGEPAHDLSFAKFHRLVMERTEAMKDKIGTDRVIFSVDVEAGHVSFKAKADK